jgi:hypothetical protein
MHAFPRVVRNIFNGIFRSAKMSPRAMGISFSL